MSTRVQRHGTVVRRVLLLAAMSFLGACLSIPLGRKEHGAPSLEWKVVAQKKEPNILLAADMTWCETSTKKFKSVKTGDGVWCVWNH
ncbi:MAG: hypothetical protein P8174_06130 [Gemmatimonadota bacterium]|jgi:hypothetical protein